MLEDFNAELEDFAAVIPQYLLEIRADLQSLHLFLEGINLLLIVLLKCVELAEAHELVCVFHHLCDVGLLETLRGFELFVVIRWSEEVAHQRTTANSINLINQARRTLGSGKESNHAGSALAWEFSFYNFKVNAANL